MFPCTLYVAFVYVCICSHRKVKAWRQKKSLSSVKKAQSGLEPRRWEQDYELIPCEGLFDEYLEIGKSSTNILSNYIDTFYRKSYDFTGRIEEHSSMCAFIVQFIVVGPVPHVVHC